MYCVICPNATKKKRLVKYRLYTTLYQFFKNVFSAPRNYSRIDRTDQRPLGFQAGNVPFNDPDVKDICVTVSGVSGRHVEIAVSKTSLKYHKSIETTQSNQCGISINYIISVSCPVSFVSVHLSPCLSLCCFTCYIQKALETTLLHCTLFVSITKKKAAL